MFSRQQFAELLQLPADWRGNNLLDLGIHTNPGPGGNCDCKDWWIKMIH